MSSRRCTCGAGQKIYCKNCSKIQMAILLKNGNDHLKYQNNRGRLCNPVWYSLLKFNPLGERQIIEGMMRRFYNTPMVSCANVIEFYDNSTNEKIYSHRL